MGKPAEPSQALLFTGLLWTDEKAKDTAVTRLNERFGRVILATPDEVFPWPDYYEPEMGSGIMRKYMFWNKLVKREEIAALKNFTNALEDEIREKYSTPGRPVNIDPGYLSMENLVLATVKGRPHRIYVGDCIYAESTLGYVHGHYAPWPWTYPDFSRPELSPFFDAARAALKRVLK